MIRRLLRTAKTSVSRGFTLVEMMVVAPIVILLIGAFIALLVNLTGEVMSSRGANVLAFDIQSALNRIEQDVKLSTTFIGETNIDLASTKQGYGTSTTAGGTVKFTNNGTGGSPASIVLNSLVTTTNPVAIDSQLVYTPNTPNSCANPLEYSKNTPMTMNIVYFIQNNALWRRVIMPADYASAGARCGSTAPWQIPTCINGYTPASLPFCKANDEKILGDITQAGFVYNYYRSADAASPDATAKGSGSIATRNTALQSDTTIEVTLTSGKAIAGRDISKTSTLRVTRLDTNASAIFEAPPPSSAPSTPAVAGAVSDGHNVTFTWPRIDTATSYSIDYRINSGAWVTGDTGLDNNSRSFVVTQGNHADTVHVRVRAHNAAGASGYGNESIEIPLWAPLILKGGWTDYRNGYSTAGYTRTKSGMIIIKGMVENPVAASGWVVIGSLPKDYAPTGRLIFGVSKSANVSGRVDIQETDDGVDVLYNMAGATSPWISLEMIQYLAADAGYTRTTAALQSGYAQYGGGYSPVTRTKTSSGRVVIEGLATGGTRTDGTLIFSLPSDYTAPQYLHLTSEASGFSHLGIDAASPSLRAKGTGGSGYYSVNANYLPTSAGVTWSNISLTNGWVNYGGVFSTAQYTKDSDGMVQLKGLIRSGTGTAGTIVGNVPAGFRPKERLLTTAASAASYGRIDVQANGNISIQAGSNSWIALDGISYMAEN